MANIPINGPAYEADTVGQNQQRLINWYLEMDEYGGKYPYILRPTPGLSSFGNISTPTDSHCRGLIEHRGLLYGVFSDKFYSVASNGSGTEEGSLTTLQGRAYLAAGGDQIMIVDGNDGYIYDTSTDTFSKITDEDFPDAPNYVTYQDGFFIVTETNSEKFYVSSVLEGTSWNALDFASANIKPDYLVACYSNFQEIWLFGEKTTEIWYNSGNVDFPFARRSSVMISKGLQAPASLTLVDNTLFWLAKDVNGASQVVRAEGYTAKAVSTPAVSRKIQGYTTTDDAFAYSHREGLHEFYVLTFPTEKVTWVYDALTGQWHERQSTVNGQEREHAYNAHAFVYGKSIVGSHLSGHLSYYSDSVLQDLVEGTAVDVKRVRRTSVISADNKLVSMYNLQVDMEKGTQNTQYKIRLKVSRDGGRSFGTELERDLPLAGEYSQRVKWDMLGQGREFVLEVAVNDPVACTIYGATADLELGSN